MRLFVRRSARRPTLRRVECGQAPGQAEGWDPPCRWRLTKDDDRCGEGAESGAADLYCFSVRRREGPLSAMRCALWSRRSQIASAVIGSPMWSW